MKIVDWQSTDSQLHVNEVQKRWEGLRTELQFMTSQLQTVAWEPGAMASEMAQNITISVKALMSQCEIQVQAVQARRKAEIQAMKDKFLHHYMQPIVNQPESFAQEADSQEADETKLDSQAYKSTTASEPLRKVAPPIFASNTLKDPPTTTAQD